MNINDQIASPSQPFGDIVFYQSPYTDNALNRLYQEQKIRQAEQRQQNKEIDKMLSSDLGKMRSVDQPDYINTYQQYKDAKKRLLFDKKLQKDAYAYNELQNRANNLLGDLKRLSSGSSELKDQLKTQAQARIKTPDLYKDEAGDYLSIAANTPLKKGGRIVVGDEEVDVFNPDSYLYTGPNTDFSSILKTAAGTPKSTITETTPIGADGIQSMQTVYEFGNSPAQYKSSLMGALVKRGSARDASYLLNKMTQSEKDEIEKKYNEIPLDKLKRMGIPQRQDLRPSNPDNDADVWSSLEAMKYAINNEPRINKQSPLTNQSALEDKRQRNKKEMAAINQGNRLALEKVKQRLKNSSAEDKNSWLDGFMIDLEERAKRNKTQYKTRNGEVLETYKMDISPKMLSSLGFTKENMPDDLRFLPNGDIMYVSYQRYPSGHKRAGELKEDKNGMRPVDTEFSGRMSKQEFKARIGKDLLGIKSLNESLDAEGDFEEEEDVQVAPVVSPKTSKKTSSIEDLRKKYNY